MLFGKGDCPPALMRRARRRLSGKYFPLYLTYCRYWGLIVSLRLVIIRAQSPKAIAPL